MDIAKNPFYKLQKAKEEYEKYKTLHTNPFLLAAKLCGILLAIGAMFTAIGALFSITIIGAVIGIPMIFIGLPLFAFSIASYPFAVLLIWLGQETAKHKTQKKNKIGALPFGIIFKKPAYNFFMSNPFLTALKINGTIFLAGIITVLIGTMISNQFLTKLGENLGGFAFATYPIIALVAFSIRHKLKQLRRAP